MEPKNQFLGVLEVNLPPNFKPISGPSDLIAVTDVTADDFFAAAASHFTGVTPHSSYLKKVDGAPFMWRADVTSPDPITERKEAVKMVILSKGSVVEQVFVLKPVVEVPAEKKKQVDGVAVNFRGIPAAIKTSDEILNFLGFPEDSIFKCSGSTYTRQNMDGKEYVLTRGTARIIFFKSKLPASLRGEKGSLTYNYFNTHPVVFWTKDKPKKRKGEPLESDNDKRKRLLREIK